MTVYKLKPKDLKDPVVLIRATKMFDEDENQSYPENIYVSDEDYETLENNVKKIIKQEYPGITSKQMTSTLGMHMLNFAPNQSLGKAIKPGYALLLRGR